MELPSRNAPPGFGPRVCHIVSGPLTGGAARGALWLHEGLNEAGCASTLLTDYAGCRLPEGVIQFPSLVHPRIDQYLRKSLEQLPVRAYPRRAHAVFSTGLWGRAIDHISTVRDADVVHLHWINGGMVSLPSLKRLRKPVVWTLRDLWPITGGCHYPSIHSCQRHLSGCGHCPHLASSRRWDLSRWVFQRKARCLPQHLTIVGISEWVANCARASPLMRGRDVLAIPNCIDTDTFSPFDRRSARSLLGLPLDRKLVLAGSLDPSEPYKGWALLMESLRLLPADFDFVLFGSIDPAHLASVPRLRRSFGMIRDDLKLRVLYAAADVFVSPSTAEAFGKTIAEAMACGTPAVAFAATGPQDIVTHLQTGFLAVPFDPVSLAEGLRWVLEHPDHAALGGAARASAVKRFSKVQAAHAYMNLYARILGTAATGTITRAPA